MDLKERGLKAITTVSSYSERQLGILWFLGVNANMGMLTHGKK
jgi:hypothetical protein